MLKFGSKNILLRDTLFFPHLVYYIAMPLNFILRFAWVVTISSNLFGLSFDQTFFVLFMSSLEIIRRGIWNIFRIENEHTSNAVLCYSSIILYHRKIIEWSP